MAVTSRRINHDANVEKYRLPSDTDAQAVQRTINMAKAASGKKRIVLPVNYALSTQIDVAGLNGMTIEGAGPDQSSHTGASAIGQYIRTTGPVQDLTIRGIGFDGSGVDDATGPRRARTWSAPNMSTAILLRGDLAPIAKLAADATSGATSISLTAYAAPGSYLLGGSAVTIASISGSVAPYTATLASPLGTARVAGDYLTVTYQVRNVLVEHCDLRNVLYAASGDPGLPVIFAGIRGEVEFNHVSAYNTMDCGFVFNEHVKVNNFRGENSADNGISISRGNQRVTAHGLTIINPAYHGVWIAGYDGDQGPKNVDLAHVNVYNPGKNGIHADGAPQYGSITDFVLDLNYRQGPSDAPGDSDGNGIYLAGMGDVTAPTALATGWYIGSGMIRRAARAGMLMYTSKAVRINGILALDIGTQYAADGTTAISSADTSRNCGFILGQSTTSDNVHISDTATIDTRTTPYCNYAITPNTSSRLVVGPGNSMVGCRNSANIVETGDVRFTNAAQRFQQGATAGQNAASGAVPGFDTNGAAASNRLAQFLTASVARWKLGADGTAESGSNAGTDYIANSYDDSGTLIATILRLTRLGAVTLGRQGRAITILGRLVSGAAAATVAAGAQASSATAAGNGANDSAGTLNVTAAASPVAGTLASVTFATAYSTTPHVVVTPANAASQAVGAYLSSRTTTGFTLSCAAAPAASASLQFDYIVIG
ncbi:hypothetical protein LH935_06995 [Gordonia polyisoprenivorans]|uniref:hypothetical protein n=1 Tax=Gordonia polyisoprenivorans TaxID=84595 RepID=UPI0022341179|nr:hypothetical protein LH935_06995 [Gordonia polyisoprenivorans]